MKPDRDIIKVLQAALMIVPDEHADLRYEMREIMESVAFCPPEGILLQWRRLYEALTDQFGDREPSAPWEKLLADLMQDRVSADDIFTRAKVVV